MSTTNIQPILKLHPDRKSTLTFTTLGTTSASSGHFFQVGTLDLNESRRKDIVYSDIRATTIAKKLVPITFEVLVWGSTKSSMLDKARELELAVCNPLGGYFEFRPEDSTGISTFYRYEQSPIPTVRKSRINHWDTIPTTDGEYVIMLQVELQTHPIGNSDPDSPIYIDSKVLSGTTISTEIDFNKLQGDQPSYLIADITNSGGGKDLNRVYIFTRSGYLTDDLELLYPILLAEDGDTDGAWSTAAGGPERYGEPQKLVPNSLNEGSWISFELEDLSNNLGRLSCFVLAQVSDDPSNWRIRSSFELADNSVIVNNDRFQPEYEDKYHWMYCGDLDISNLLLPNDVAVPDSGIIKLYVDKIAGAVESPFIQIDALLLVYQDESAMQVNVSTDTTVGFSENESIKIDYLYDKQQRTVLHLDDGGELLRFVATVFGSPAIEVNPKFNTVVAFVGEAVSSFSNMASTYTQLTTYCSAIFRTIYPFGS